MTDSPAFAFSDLLVEEADRVGGRNRGQHIAGSRHREGGHRGAAGHRLDDREPEGFGEGDRVQQRVRGSEHRASRGKVPIGFAVEPFDVEQPPSLVRST